MTRFDVALGVFSLLVSLGVLGGLYALHISLQAAPQAPPAPTVTTYRDAAAAVTCWLAHSPHGVGISCVQDRTTPAGVFVP